MLMINTQKIDMINRLSYQCEINELRLATGNLLR